jgi:hypothetical protein
VLDLQQAGHGKTESQLREVLNCKLMIKLCKIQQNTSAPHVYCCLFLFLHSYANPEHIHDDRVRRASLFPVETGK